MFHRNVLPVSNERQDGSFLSQTWIDVMFSLLDWTDNSSTYQQSVANHRYHLSTVSNQYGPELLSTSLIAGSNNDRGIEMAPPKRQLPPLPINQLPNRTAPLSQHAQRTLDIDDNEEFLPTENGSFSANISYVQPAQRRLHQLTQVSCRCRTPHDDCSCFLCVD